MNLQNVRELFPHIKRNIIYLNHASRGPLCTPVIDSINLAIAEQSTERIDDYPSFLNIMVETRELLSKMINGDSDRIAFLDNTTNAINVIANGINWKRGDRILLNDIEFPANVYPFLNLKSEGVGVDFVKSENGIVSAEKIIEAIKPSTKLISISAVQFLSGYRVDMELIGEICKEKNIIFSVDAIQALGAVQIDIKKCNIDFLACGSQKWMLGLQGFAFIYVAKHLQETMQPKNIGWLSVEDAWNLLHYNLKLKNSALAFQGGTVNNFGVYALNSALKLFFDYGFDNIESNVIRNSKYVIQKLNELGFTSSLTGLNEKNIAGIVSFAHPKSEEIYRSLSRGKIFISSREGFIRISPHFYNTKDEIDYLISEFKKYC